MNKHAVFCDYKITLHVVNDVMVTKALICGIRVLLANNPFLSSLKELCNFTYVFKKYVLLSKLVK